MKKLLLGLIATVVLTGMSFGQSVKIDESKIANSQMVAAVNVFKSNFNGEKSYEIWKSNNEIKLTTKTQEAFFTKIYSYLNAKADDCTILKSNNDVLLKLVQESQNSTVMVTKRAEGDKLKWWQRAINLIVQVAVAIICGNNGVDCGNTPPVF